MEPFAGLTEECCWNMRRRDCQFDEPRARGLLTAEGGGRGDAQPFSEESEAWTHWFQGNHQSDCKKIMPPLNRSSSTRHVSQSGPARGPMVCPYRYTAWKMDIKGLRTSEQ